MSSSARQARARCGEDLRTSRTNMGGGGGGEAPSLHPTPHPTADARRAASGVVRAQGKWRKGGGELGILVDGKKKVFENCRRSAQSAHACSGSCKRRPAPRAEEAGVLKCPLLTRTRTRTRSTTTRRSGFAISTPLSRSGRTRSRRPRGLTAARVRRARGGPRLAAHFPSRANHHHPRAPSPRRSLLLLLREHRCVPPLFSVVADAPKSAVFKSAHGH